MYGKFEIVAGDVTAWSETPLRPYCLIRALAEARMSREEVIAVVSSSLTADKIQYILFQHPCRQTNPITGH